MNNNERLALQNISDMIAGVLDGTSLPPAPEESPPVPAKSASLLPVPYVSQKGNGANRYINDCGAAAGVMLVRAYTGESITPDRFYKMTGQRTDRYLSAHQIIDVMSQMGVKADWRKNLKFDDIFQALMYNRPVIALIDYKKLRQAVKTESNFAGPHFVPVIGINIKTVYIHDSLWSGKGGESLAVPINTFLESWETPPQNSGLHRGAIIPHLPLGKKLANSFKVRVTATWLNVRKGPGTSYAKYGPPLRYREIVSVFETSDKWGRIGPSHWIHLDYTERI